MGVGHYYTIIVVLCLLNHIYFKKTNNKKAVDGYAALRPCKYPGEEDNNFAF